jgi:hypothetical protein
MRIKIKIKTTANLKNKNRNYNCGPHKKFSRKRKQLKRANPLINRACERMRECHWNLFHTKKVVK